MKRLNLAAVVVLSISLLFAACSKSDSNNTSKTKTQLITQGSWKFSSATVNGTDVSSLIQTCQKDNTLTFSATGGTGTLDEGATKCSASDPQTTPFTWSFTNNESTLHVSQVFFTGGSSDFTIVSLTDTQLVVSQIVNVSGTMQTAVITFIH
jgi:major membrane immunogen (membrane-anchored lipoprotein)